MNTELNDFIASLGLSYSAKFIPQSQSRNAKEKNLSLNWIVSISKGNTAINTDYMQGIAHLPLYFNSNNAAYYNYLKQCVENGKYSKNAISHKAFHSLGQWATVPIPAPKLEDVLYSLAMDCDVFNYSCFEEWAENLGYETDSRQAEKIYHACLENALKMRSMLGNDNLEKLQELFQDY